MTTLANVKLLEIKEVQKKHLRGKPLYVAVYEDKLNAKTEVEIGLRIEPPELYKIGEEYQVETESKFGSERVVSVTPQGGSAPGSYTSIYPPKGRTIGSYGKEFPVPTLHGDRSIIRQNSLKHAGDLFTAMQPITGGDKAPTDKMMAKAAGQIIELARLFEEYSAGDVERRVAEELAASAAQSDPA